MLERSSLGAPQMQGSPKTRNLQPLPCENLLFHGRTLPKSIQNRPRSSCGKRARKKDLKKVGGRPQKWIFERKVCFWNFPGASQNRVLAPQGFYSLPELPEWVPGTTGMGSWGVLGPSWAPLAPGNLIRDTPELHFRRFTSLSPCAAPRRIRPNSARGGMCAALGIVLMLGCFFEVHLGPVFLTFGPQIG